MPQTLGTNFLTGRFQEALQFATQIHQHQIRKISGTPYVTHLLGVCSLVLADGGNEDEAIAALLHDSLEDHPETVTPQLLKELFGEVVMRMVIESSDTPENYRGGTKAPWFERKQGFLNRFDHQGTQAERIIIADKLDNLRSTVNGYRTMGEMLWPMFRAPRDMQLWYYEHFSKILHKKRITSPMIHEYDTALMNLFLLLEKTAKAA